MKSWTSSGVVQNAGCTFPWSCWTCMLHEPPKVAKSQLEKSKPGASSTCCGERTTRCQASLSDAHEVETGKRLHGLTENDRMYEVKVEPWELELPDLLAEAKFHGRRKGWVYHVLKAKYGDEVADKAWPRIRATKKWAVKTRPVTTPA